ncbi:hypothetical protein MVEN_00465500 [Mycena venus]|uniref:CCHC-type domain-containing protein n=1 Tax=Mycena venus TaxID=2733690 RepID=A0A8H7D943_9AGAR|nr:hypothetical protein MVEN_00465500 [Mycena venus]
MRAVRTTSANDLSCPSNMIYSRRTLLRPISGPTNTFYIAPALSRAAGTSYFGAHREGFHLTISSEETRSLRPNPLRTLRTELRAVRQNPHNLADTSRHSSSSESSELFVPVPDHLAQHNNLSPVDPLSPTLAFFFDTPTTPTLDTSTPPPFNTMVNGPPAAHMPARGERGAPTFDSAKPRELNRYFDDLEFHFTRCSITDDAAKKQHATRYLSVDDQDVWQSLPEHDQAHTYQQFKAAVLKLYPGTDANRKFSMADLDALIGEYQRIGILSRGDYSDFYRKFILYTQYLISHNRLSLAEQSRAFKRAIAPPHLWNSVHQRLQIKKPDVHPEDPYDLADLNEAVEFVLAETPAARVANTPAISSAVTSAASEIKQEPRVTDILDSINGLIKVLTAQQQLQSSRGPGASYNQLNNGSMCAYCGESGHFIAKCPHVEEDTKNGKCKRDVEGRVTLPSGAFVPRRIEGRNLRARIDEWHRQNPGQLAAAQLMVTTQYLSSSNPPVPATVACASSATSFILSEDDRIQSLEQELYALRTRAQARLAAAAGEPVESPEQPVRRTPTPVAAPPPPPAASQPTVPHIATRPTALPLVAPEHPFAKARDAAYAPPRDRNVGARAPPHSAPTKKPEAAYRSTAPIYDEKVASAVFDRSMDAPITLTQRELLSLSPDVRAQVRDATTSRRVPQNSREKPAADSAPPVNQFLANSFPAAAEAMDSLSEQKAKDARTTAFLDSMPTTFAQAAQYELPADAFVVPDPYEAYYSAGMVSEDLIVSLESSAIRSILPVVNNHQKIECIIDGGSQIIAMSDTICHELGLPYDPPHYPADAIG